MKISYLFYVIISLTVAAGCATAGSFHDEIKSLKSDSSIKCTADRMQPADSLMGAMWSCRKEGESMKLYVTEEAGSSGVLKRVMFKAERPANGDFSSSQRDFIESLFKHYSQVSYQDLMVEFISCENKKSKIKDYEVSFICHKGTSLISHAVNIVKS